MRAAQARMRTRQGIAHGGMIAAGLMIGLATQVDDLAGDGGADRMMTIVVALGSSIILATAIPFLNSACPKCGGRYHGVLSLFASPERPPPCRRCGFHIDTHVSRYS